MDVARNFLGSRNPLSSELTPYLRNPALIKYQNKTDASLPPFSVIQLGEAPILPEDNLEQFQAEPILEGLKPTATLDKSIAVTLTGADSDSIGNAILIGVTACKLNVTSDNEDYGWASSSVGTTEYAVPVEAGGFAKILWKEEGTGERQAILLLNGGSDESDQWFPVNVTDRKGDTNLYSFEELRFLEDGLDEVKPGGRGGSNGAWVEIETTVEGDDDNDEIFEEQKITLHNEEDGTWTLSDGVTTETLDWDADAAAVQAAVNTILGSGVATVTEDAGSFVITWENDGEQDELEVDGEGLLPGPANPLYEVNEAKIKPPSKEWAKVGYKANPKFVLTKVQTGNGDDEPTIYELWLDDWDKGTFTLSIDGDTDSNPIDVEEDIAAIDIEGAITTHTIDVTGAGTEDSPFVITITTDNDDHDMTADKDELVDKTDYRFRGGHNTCPGKHLDGFAVYNLQNILALTPAGCMKVLPAAPCGNADEDEELILYGGTL